MGEVTLLLTSLFFVFITCAEIPKPDWMDTPDNHIPEITITPVSGTGSDDAHVQENAMVGTIIAHVSVNDPDPGSNGETVCSMKEFGGNQGETFDLVMRSQNKYMIILRERVDAEARIIYHLTIECIDQGAPPQHNQKTLNVFVDDDNDNMPEVVVEPSGVLKVAESLAPGSSVAHVWVSDPDLGDNGDVTCSLEPEGVLQLVKVYSDEYELLTSRVFDRERVPQYTVQIQCRDHGSPSLSMNRQIHLLVMDVNDNAPVFSKHTFTADVSQGAEVGEKVIQITAKDADVGNNAELSYSLQDTDFLSIDEQTGVVRIKNNFRYDDVTQYETVVTATDHGFPPQTRVASLLINVIKEH